MKLKRRTSLKLHQLLVITCLWLVVGFIITVYDYLILHTENSLGTTANYSFTFSLIINLGVAFIGAMLGGSFLVFFVNVKYQDKPYGYTILAVTASFILIIALIAFIIGLIYIPLKSGRPLGEVLQADFKNFLFDNSRTIKNAIVWSIVVGITQLFLQMNSKFGYGVFWNIIRGKYNTPKEEYRIFMSIDLNSSTAIAEGLGHEKYHELLKDFFADITNPILDNNGEIYQYVGDEVIIAWKYAEGIADNQCVKCFFDMKQSLENQKVKYSSNYGIFPSFKAGIHWGKVVVGEVGIIKRDITYSGDVMNTTARIRDKCKEFDVEIIASTDLLGKLNLKNYSTRSLGAIELRGKEKEVLLSSLMPVG
jgi:adenylate cyclase